MSVIGVCNNCMELNNGFFNTIGSTIPLYLDAVNEDNISISGCVEVSSEIIRTNPEVIEYDECGCPIDDCEKASLRINISKNSSSPIDCGYNGFTLDAEGLVLFNLYDGNTSYFMNSQCCSALGFTPILQNGIYICQWFDNNSRNPCDDYTPLDISDGYMTFLNSNGERVNIISNSECCPIGTTPELTVGGYLCKENRVKMFSVCENYKPSSITKDGVVIFSIFGGGLTTDVQAECCDLYGYSTVIENGKVKCVATCENYTSTSVDEDGYIIFIRPNSSIYTEVPLIECCPLNTIPTPIITQEGLNYYKCKQ